MATPGVVEVDKLSGCAVHAMLGLCCKACGTPSEVLKAFLKGQRMLAHFGGKLFWDWWGDFVAGIMPDLSVAGCEL